MLIIGSNGWADVRELFYVLNETIDYVVMRNFEPLPDEYFLGSHGDIDILVDSLKDAVWITKAEPIFKESHRVHMNIKINNENIPFDIRHVGDDYYDENWQKNILLHRKFNKHKGICIPNAENHFYTLLYHGLIQKWNIKEEYVNKLIEIFPGFSKIKTNESKMADLLGSWMNDKKYKVTKAEPSVVFNEEEVKKVKEFIE